MARQYTMKGKVISFVLLITICSCQRNDQASGGREVSASDVVSQADTLHRGGQVWEKETILVLPPFDVIANEGISPPVQEFLEAVIAEDTSVTLIKFPFRELMNVPYQNVFDKRYCKPITDVVKADIIVMTKLEQRKRTGNMATDKWDLRVRVLNTRTNRQFDSKLTADTVTSAGLRKVIANQREMLIGEIKLKHD
jgi:hypothetical protein